MGDEIAARRRLRFYFVIETELGEGDDALASMRYVADWLNDNGYGYRELTDHDVTPMGT